MMSFSSEDPLKIIKVQRTYYKLQWLKNPTTIFMNLWFKTLWQTLKKNITYEAFAETAQFKLGL